MDRVDPFSPSFLPTDSWKERKDWSPRPFRLIGIVCDNDVIEYPIGRRLLPPKGTTVGENRWIFPACLVSVAPPRWRGSAQLSSFHSLAEIEERESRKFESNRHMSYDSTSEDNRFEFFWFSFFFFFVSSAFESYGSWYPIILKTDTVFHRWHVNSIEFEKNRKI